MPKNLVIVESPSKANTIKHYLGSNYKVMASIGHVRDLPKSTLGVDIENNFEPKYINIRGKAPLINELKKEAKNADKIFLATDPDREGEAISWHLATALNIPVEETKRITFNEITKTAVKNAIKEPRTIDMDLVNSQQARRILDRIVGYKLSPFLWQHVKSGLSAGRVQSVATRIIVEREEAIRAFIPQEYWTIGTLLETPKKKSFTAKFFGDAKTKKKIDLNTEDDAKKIVDSVKDSPFKVVSVKKSVKHKNPAPPFITSTLQQEAAQKLGFQIQRTMKIAQELYEGVNVGSENGGTQGLITYMRTDSTRISTEAVGLAKELISEKYGADYYPNKPHVFKSKGDAQDAHEAVRPSNPKLEPDKIKSHLSADQYKLYKLIWSRFIASQMASALLDTITADIESAGYLFRASGYTIKFQGYMAVYEESETVKDDDAPEKTQLPDFKEDDILKLLKITPSQHFTEPPPRFTEATLVNFFKEKGIGRPSTYLSIITTIINRGYVIREKKILKPTQLGEITTQMMKQYFPDVVNYEFTAQMEDELDNIENGEMTISDVLSEFYKEFEAHLDKANQSVSKEDIKIPVEETDIICEKCGSKMVVKHGRYGKFAACPNYPECKNTKPLNADGQAIDPDTENAEITDIKCELCGKDMVIKRGRFGSFYACSNYPECKNTKPMTKDTGIKCPLCGGKILSKQSKKKLIYYNCEKYPDCQFSSWDMPTNEKCPTCGKMLFRKKGKPQLVCHDRECGYKIDVDPENENNENNEEN